uniref:Uncharacterized protein n=1 Tax=Labrus bergylta TaxID=56723 RepID=A0A3Q3GH06_9LABR
NVFIEASRPEYLENLHSEALEGLKMMQEEGTKHCRDAGYCLYKYKRMFFTYVQICLESTFRPLNSGKKSKTRRRHRKTVAGIPQHVQRELGMELIISFYCYNTIRKIKATQSQTGTSAAIHPLNKKQLEQLAATNAGHRDDLALLNRLDPGLSAEQRHHSLAVHWMTTANNLQQEPPSPVMSMSPQAMYMSKIIPNAVLPPSIDVVEISRGRSRNSVRTVSKSSLVMSSPAPSRASSRASSTRTTSSKASTITSASRQNLPNMSDSSGWSNSESSETLVSDSSTISSSSTPRQNRSQDGNVSAKEDNISVHSSISKASKSTSNGKLVSKRVVENKEGPFVRSLSVMKPKRAPLPPNRSYSLHNKMKRRSRDVAEVRVIPGEENEKNKSGSSPIPSKIIDSPGYTADTSSLEDSTGSVSFSPIRTQLNMLKAGEAAKVGQTDSKDASQEKNKQSTVVSPSSGYSSQEGTSAVSSKQSHSSSPSSNPGVDSYSTPTPLNIPPPPSYTAPAPPVEAVTPATLRRLTPLPPIEEVPFTPPPEEVSPPELPIEASPPLPTPLNEVRPPPALIDVSPPQPPIAFSLLPPPTKEVIPSPPPPTEFIPPPPPKDVFPLPPPIEVIQLQPPKETSPVPPPKEFIPPPPPIEVIQTPPPEEASPPETPPPPTPQASPPAPEKAQEPAPPAPANIPLPPPLPSAEPQVIPASKEKQTPEQTSTPVMPVEPTPIVTPSLLQMVKLRSVNSSPEPPKAPEQPGEAPQKPIRRSLIILSPTSPTSTSPPAAIRLRTAARSKENAPSRLSLHSPTSPRDLHKSPSSTASFIFSKSNKRVVIETKPVEEKKSLDVPSVTKVETDAESEKKGGKVPPPVAKKPKTKGKETETCEGVEQTAGQDAHQELIKGKTSFLLK